MGNSNSTLTESDVRKMINEGISEYNSSCQKTMVATLVRSDGTTQEMHCSGRARTFWLMVFSVLNFLVYLILFTLGMLSRYDKVYWINKDGSKKDKQSFLIYTGIGLSLSFITTMLSFYSWKFNTYGDVSTWSTLMAYIYGQDKSETYDKTFSYEIFQPCSTRRTPQDCKGSTYTEIIIPNTRKAFNRLPQDFKNNNTWTQAGITNKITGAVSSNDSMMFVERNCSGYTKLVTEADKLAISKGDNKTVKTGKKKFNKAITKGKKLFYCGIADANNNQGLQVTMDNKGEATNIVEKAGKNIKGKLVQADNLVETYSKNLKLLPCNRRESQNICLEAGGKDCEWVDQWVDRKAKKGKKHKVCKKKWKPFQGANYGACDECDDLSQFCTLSGRTWAGAFVFTVCGVMMIVAGFEVQDTNEDLSEDLISQLYDPLAITCYVLGTVTLLVGFAYIALSLMCPAGSDIWVMGVEDGDIYKSLWSGLN
jgi:hypothetical protein